MEALNLSTFNSLTGTRFETTGKGCLSQSDSSSETPAGIGLKLIKVTERDDEGYFGVSLIFNGPASPFLPQKTYNFVHETLGELDMFLVPIGELKENHEGKIVRTGFQYQSIFTRLK
jgi:hypothetical protein